MVWYSPSKSPGCGDGIFNCGRCDRTIRDTQNHLFSGGTQSQFYSFWDYLEITHFPSSKKMKTEKKPVDSDGSIAPSRGNHYPHSRSSPWAPPLPGCFAPCPVSESRKAVQKGSGQNSILQIGSVTNGIFKEEKFEMGSKGIDTQASKRSKDISDEEHGANQGWWLENVRSFEDTRLESQYELVRTHCWAAGGMRCPWGGTDFVSDRKSKIISIHLWTSTVLNHTHTSVYLPSRGDTIITSTWQIKKAKLKEVKLLTWSDLANKGQSQDLNQDLCPTSKHGLALHKGVLMCRSLLLLVTKTVVTYEIAQPKALLL